MNTFQTAIEAKVTANNVRFMYLTQHCTGEARQAIQMCQLLTGQQLQKGQAYFTILQERFGRIKSLVHVLTVLCLARQFQVQTRRR